MSGAEEEADMVLVSAISSAAMIAIRFAFYLAACAIVAVLLGCGGSEEVAALIDPVCINADNTPCKD